MLLVDNRLDEIYLNGVKFFLNYTFQKIEQEYEIICPCVNCYNTTLGTNKKVMTHLLVQVIIFNYTLSYQHGEHLGDPLSE